MHKDVFQIVFMNTTIVNSGVTIFDTDGETKIENS